MRIQLIDRNIQMCEAWHKYFKRCSDILITHNDFFSLLTDCIVSPANSFGFMDGGLELDISKKLGWQIERKIQKVINEKYFGEILVGQAELIQTEVERIPYLIFAPTMRVPMILTQTVNVYLASKAIFYLLKKHPEIKVVSISGLGTGIGEMPFEICARQMKQAYDDIWLDKYVLPDSWQEVQKRHQLLYSEKYRDLMLNEN